jgi:hypothetical protein
MLLRFNAAVRLLEEADVNPGVFSTTENQIAAVIQSTLAHKAAEDPTKIAPAPGDGREAKFDERDVRWALSLITWVGKLRPHGWLPLPDSARPMADTLRFAVMGDWGTGLYGGPRCAQSIAQDGAFQGLIHLGDVYYSGTMSEVRDNFLKFWPGVNNALRLACNGNHEMYSGGYGYFDAILPEFGQTSSGFALENTHWLIVGLDSAYADHDLANHQDAWLRGLVDASPTKKLVLFSHHQPFSHFDEGGEKLIEKLLPFLSAGRITAWYWGHEHRCVIYDRHPEWDFFGRCLGHSGYPYFRKPSLAFHEVVDPPQQGYGFWRELPRNATTGAPRALLLDGPNPYVEGHKDEYGPNGYVTLEFDGPHLTEHYFLPEGTELHKIDIA